MTKHTPGPWKARHRHAYATPTSDAIGGLGWEIEGPPEPMRGQFALAADAHLVAAAPETAAERDRLKESNAHLLEALKGLRCIMSENHCTCDDCLTSKASALDAIRKAEGDLGE